MHLRQLPSQTLPSKIHQYMTTSLQPSGLFSQKFISSHLFWYSNSDKYNYHHLSCFPLDILPLILKHSQLYKNGFLSFLNLKSSYLSAQPEFFEHIDSKFCGIGEWSCNRVGQRRFAAQGHHNSKNWTEGLNVWYLFVAINIKLYFFTFWSFYSISSFGLQTTVRFAVWFMH